MTYTQRNKLFADPRRLLKFSEKVMPVVDPSLWDEFRDHCNERGYDLADEVARVLGSQKDYETQQSLETN
jgi:hypothetical protein